MMRWIIADRTKPGKELVFDHPGSQGNSAPLKSAIDHLSHIGFGHAQRERAWVALEKARG